MPWQVPGYRPREDLAGGGGRVVLAVEESSGQLVVIKYLNADSSYTSDELRTAIDEVSGLPDHYFVRIRELVQDSGRNAIVMDPLTGTTMRALIRDDGPFKPESALVVFRDILTGLTYAHAIDIVHGEVTPENAMVGTDGRPVLLNAGAAIWDRHEPTLSSGVYLAPERWNGGPPTAPADVYAATVGFVESLVGEPPYWEDTDLDRLRRRHASEDVDVSHVPAALRDVVRAGMAKTADARLAAAALLDLVETAAIAGYGHDWPDRGRDDVVQLVRARVPGDASAADADVRETEDVANDDYYTDAHTDASAADAGSARAEPHSDEPSTEPPSGDVAADAVMAAAAEIVAFAQLRDAAEADAIQAASVDEELTEEEESAVTEIERLLFPDQEPLLDEPTPTSEASDPAVGDGAAETVAAEGVIAGAAESRSDAEVDDPTLGKPADPALAEPASPADEAVPAEAVAAADASADEPAGAAGSVPPDEPAAAESVPANRSPADAETVAPPPGSNPVPTQSPSGIEREPVPADPDHPAAGFNSGSGSDRVPAQATSAEALAAAEVAAAAAADRAGAPPAAAGEPVATRSATGSASAADGAARPSDAASADEGTTPLNTVREPAGTLSGSGGGRRPWWLALGAVAAVVVVAGLLVWAGVGRSGSSSRPAAGASSQPTAASSVTTPPTGQPSASIPASAGGAPIGGTPTSTPVSPPAPTSSPGSAPPSGASPSPGAPGKSSTGPTLPVTGFEHPIRLMAAVAAGFVFVGAFLLYAGRRRDEASADDA